MALLGVAQPRQKIIQKVNNECDNEHEWNCATKEANLCQQVRMISEGFECMCVLQDGTQSDNIGLTDLYVSKAYNMLLRACRPSDEGHLSVLKI